MYEYPSVICKHCSRTDYGFAPVGTSPYNMCEGVECEEAYESWQGDNPEDDSSLEDLF